MLLACTVKPPNEYHICDNFDTNFTKMKRGDRFKMFQKKKMYTARLPGSACEVSD